jgi:hypothetical protein
MRALGTDAQREFVGQILNQPKRNAAAAYRTAYPKCAPENSYHEAYRLLHSAPVQAALHEEASARLHSLMPGSLRVAEEIMENPDAKDADRAKIVLAIWASSGLHQVTEHKVTVGLAGDTEALAQIKLLAERNGIPLESLLGGRLMKQIEHEPAMMDVTPIVDIPE